MNQLNQALKPTVTLPFPSYGDRVGGKAREKAAGGPAANVTLYVTYHNEGGHMADQNPFIWHELVTPDQNKSGAFFSQLFGWTRKEVDAGEFGTYTLFQKEGQDVAGMMNPTPETPSNEPFWHSYIAVENVDECAKRAPSLGGSVVVPPHDVPDVGRICIVADPTGAIAHLMQPIKQ